MDSEGQLQTEPMISRIFHRTTHLPHRHTHEFIAGNYVSGVRCNLRFQHGCVYRFLCSLCLFFALELMAFANVNVLVIGSTKTFSSITYSSAEQAFNASAVATQLRSILQGDGTLGTVNVVFDDIYTSKVVHTRRS